jgi:HTH-type transcriptional regulator/antitoxin HigA
MSLANMESCGLTGRFLQRPSFHTTMTPEANPEPFKTPGQLIESLLETVGWSKRVLSIILNIHESTINKIISGDRAVDAEMALALSEVFGIPAERFLALQKSYDLARARFLQQPDPGRMNRAHLFGGLPISDMIQRGWIRAESVRDVAQVERELTKFFRANATDEIEILPHAAKKTKASEDVTPVQLAWLYRVNELASEMLTPPFSEVALHGVLGKLKDYRSAPELARHVPKMLHECGIRFLIVEKLPGAKIDGVCFWLDDLKPVVALSMQHDRIDNFWFVLRHELEHVARGHGKNAIMLDAELSGERAGTGPNISEEERQANEAASEFCVPQRQMKQFIDRKAPYFAERDIIGFAKTIGVHPGMVAGQLQFKTERYDRFRTHLVKIRSCVAPSALVDGWGDVVPTGI